MADDLLDDQPGVRARRDRGASRGSRPGRRVRRRGRSVDRRRSGRRAARPGAGGCSSKVSARCHPGGGQRVDVEEAAVVELGVADGPAGQTVVLAGEDEVESFGVAGDRGRALRRARRPRPGRRVGSSTVRVRHGQIGVAGSPGRRWDLRQRASSRAATPSTSSSDLPGDFGQDRPFRLGAEREGPVVVADHGQAPGGPSPLEPEVPGLELAAVVVAEDREQQRVGDRPVDVEHLREPAGRSKSQHVPPPRVRVVGREVVRHDVDQQAQPGGAAGVGRAGRTPPDHRAPPAVGWDR